MRVAAALIDRAGAWVNATPRPDARVQVAIACAVLAGVAVAALAGALVGRR